MSEIDLDAEQIESAKRRVAAGGLDSHMTVRAELIDALRRRAEAAEHDASNARKQAVIGGEDVLHWRKRAEAAEAQVAALGRRGAQRRKEAAAEGDGEKNT